MKRISLRISVFAMLLVAAMMLAACGGSASPTAQPTTSAGSSTASSTSATAAATSDANANSATAEATEDGFGLEPANPTPEATLPLAGTPSVGGSINNPSGTPVAVDPPKNIKPPKSLDELKAAYPDLGPYIDSVKDKAWNGIDFSELYKKVVAVYEKEGASGVATFLKDSGILEKLNIPLSYLDLLIAYGDKGDIKAVETLARQRKLISSKDEVVGYLAIDDVANQDAVKTDLAALGVSVYGYDANRGELEIGIPLNILGQLQTPSKLIDYLAKIGNTSHVVGFRPPEPKLTDGLSMTRARVLASVGAKTIGADKWNAAGITGKGIKIGVLDMGFGGILKSVGKELPEADQIKSFQPLDELDQLEEVHGTAVATVVHGVAPDAELYLAYFDGSSYSEFIDAVNWLIDSKVQIINYSVGSSVGPRDGTYGDALVVQEVVEKTGILWVSAAGNEADNHTMFKYNENSNGVHAFSDDVEALPFMPYVSDASVIMNWNGNWGGKEKSEYDFSIQDKDGNEVATGAEAKRGRKNDLPIQGTSFEANPGEIYYMVIQRTKGTKDNILDIFISNAVLPDWAKVPQLSVSTPGDSDASFTVGATGLEQDQIEDYSSQGPTLDKRLKPDISAPTGEVVMSYPEGFTGTSGAAPLTAGAAGLVMQKFPDMSAEEVRAFLTDNSKDLGDKGADPVFGIGRLTMPDPGGVSDDNPGTTDDEKINNSTDPAATIVSIDTNYNMKQKGKKGLGVTVSFEVANLKGKKGAVAVLFYDADGDPLTTDNEDFQIGKGLGTARPFTAKFDKTAFDDVVLFIPLTAFSDIPKNAKEIQYRVAIFDLDNVENPLVVSDMVKVKIKR